jgi:hypothetical protein
MKVGVGQKAGNRHVAPAVWEQDHNRDEIRQRPVRNPGREAAWAQGHRRTGASELASRNRHPVKITKFDKAPAAARVSAAVAILDRGFGKPAEFSTANPTDFLKMSELTDEELLEIIERGRMRRGANGNAKVVPLGPEDGDDNAA